MGLFEHFPWTDFHDLNLNWLLKKIGNHEKRITDLEEDDIQHAVMLSDAKEATTTEEEVTLHFDKTAYNDGDVISTEDDPVTIEAATEEHAGVMTAADKIAQRDHEERITDLEEDDIQHAVMLSNVEPADITANSVTINNEKKTYEDGDIVNTEEIPVVIPAATEELAGVMTAEDKVTQRTHGERITALENADIQNASMVEILTPHTPNATQAGYDVLVGTYSNGRRIGSSSPSFVQMQNADGSHAGTLKAEDWNTFNDKQDALTPVSPIEIDNSGNISIPNADATHTGALTAADWNTFNNKLDALTGVRPVRVNADNTVDILGGLASGETAGEGATAEGNGNKASGIYSHAEGLTVEASGTQAHAEGQQTVASGQSSHAEGVASIASAYGAHAEGTGSEASGDSAHAEGFYADASGNRAHAEGEYTSASGVSSHAEGTNTTAASDYQHVSGKYNIVDNNNEFAEIVGNGDMLAASNARTLDWNGKEKLADTLEVARDPVTNLEVATKQYVDNNAGGAQTYKPGDTLTFSYNALRGRSILGMFANVAGTKQGMLVLDKQVDSSVQSITISGNVTIYDNGAETAIAVNGASVYPTYPTMNIVRLTSSTAYSLTAPAAFYLVSGQSFTITFA